MVVAMESNGPFGFTFLQIIAAVVIVGVAGIALINYLIADFAHLL
jgi:hypothetical protein